MSLSEYVCYENKIKRPESLRTYLQTTKKEEWTERFEFVYKCSKEYIALSKTMSDAYVNYVLYNNKYLYTNDMETTSAMHSYLYSFYTEIRYKRFQLTCAIGRAFKERFPSIRNPSYEIDHYLYCCELYASHRLKGIEYNLPFPVENDISAVVILDNFQLEDEKSKPSEDKPAEDNTTQIPEGPWEDHPFNIFMKDMRSKSKSHIVNKKGKA